MRFAAAEPGCTRFPCDRATGSSRTPVSTRRRLYTPMLAWRSRSDQDLDERTASLPTSRIGTTRPPSRCTMNGGPPTSVVTTGNADAIASSNVMPNGSPYDGMQYTECARMMRRDIVARGAAAAEDALAERRRGDPFIHRSALAAIAPDLERAVGHARRHAVECVEQRENAFPVFEHRQEQDGGARRQHFARRILLAVDAVADHVHALARAARRADALDGGGTGDDQRIRLRLLQRRECVAHAMLEARGQAARLRRTECLRRPVTGVRSEHERQTRCRATRGSIPSRRA